MYTCSIAIPHEASPFDLHDDMFTPTMESQTSPEQAKSWLDKVYNKEIIGTYAQTEMGHGRSRSCLPLKHTVLHPSGTSCCKTDITNSGFLANYAHDSFDDP